TSPFKLTAQAVQIVAVVVGPLAVLAFLVMSGTAREPGALRMIDAGQSAIAEAIPFAILVAGETTNPAEASFRQDLAALNRLSWILERVRHPVVHAEVQVAHHKDWRLQLVGEIERLVRHGEALRRRTRNQHGMNRVAVRQLGHELDIALRGA